jgi:hypothetical protein
VAGGDGGDGVSTRDRNDGAGFMGAGLSGTALAAIIAVSTGAFLFWGGPLWRAAPGASHVTRIGGSYLMVIPLALAALAVTRRLSFSHLLGCVGIVWSAKLLITASAYSFIAPGSATVYAPAQPWETARAPASDHRADRTASPPRTSAGTGTLSGVVVVSGTPVAYAALIVDGAAEGSGRSLRNPKITIDRARYVQSIYLSSSDDHILVENHDASLHTLRVTREQRAIANVPVPPGLGERSIPAPEPGSYELSCENHASEHALLVVVDHPLVTLTDSNGRFELRGVPTGRDEEVTILRQGQSPSRRTFRAAEDGHLELSIDLR